VADGLVASTRAFTVAPAKQGAGGLDFELHVREPVCLLSFRWVIA
jgi:hypothetical protein